MFVLLFDVLGLEAILAIVHREYPMNKLTAKTIGFNSSSSIFVSSAINLWSADFYSEQFFFVYRYQSINRTFIIHKYKKARFYLSWIFSCVLFVYIKWIITVLDRELIQGLHFHWEQSLTFVIWCCRISCGDRCLNK